MKDALKTLHKKLRAAAVTAGLSDATAADVVFPAMQALELFWVAAAEAHGLRGNRVGQKYLADLTVTPSTADAVPTGYVVSYNGSGTAYNLMRVELSGLVLTFAYPKNKAKNDEWVDAETVTLTWDSPPSDAQRQAVVDAVVNRFLATAVLKEYEDAYTAVVSA